MRSNRIYISFLVISIVAYVLVELGKPDPVDWSNDFTRGKSIPYATEILFDEIETLFPNQNILFNEVSLYVSEIPDKQSQNWIFINSELNLDQQESLVLLKEVKNGDQVFIGGLINGFLADTLNLAYEYYYSFFDSSFSEDSVSLTLNSEFLGINDSWRFDADGTYHHIVSFDSTKTSELGMWENGDLNFVKIDFGKGSFYVNSTPYLFSNYYMREPDYAKYAFSVLSHLPEQTTVWDSYYKDGKPNPNLGTPLYVILNTEYLNYAWYTALIALVLFMIFHAKRRQKVIPVIPTLNNSTIEFTTTIGNLYQEQGSHKNILEKKIQFFLEYINSHLRLDTTEIHPQLRNDISERSGIDKQTIDILIDSIDLSKNSPKISDAQLKTITDQIDQFYKLTQR